MHPNHDDDDDDENNNDNDNDNNNNNNNREDQGGACMSDGSTPHGNAKTTSYDDSFWMSKNLYKNASCEGISIGIGNGVDDDDESHGYSILKGAESLFFPDGTQNPTKLHPPLKLTLAKKSKAFLSQSMSSILDFSTDMSWDTPKQEPYEDPRNPAKNHSRSKSIRNLFGSHQCSKPTVTIDPINKNNMNDGVVESPKSKTKTKKKGSTSSGAGLSLSTKTAATTTATTTATTRRPLAAGAEELLRKIMPLAFGPNDDKLLGMPTRSFTFHPTAPRPKKNTTTTTATTTARNTTPQTSTTTTSTGRGSSSSSGNVVMDSQWGVW